MVALSTNTRVGDLAAQALRHRPRAVCVCAPEHRAAGADAALAAGAEFHAGEPGLAEMVDRYDADLVVVATVGFVGLVPTLHAIARGITVALANKEVLVTAGDLVMGAGAMRAGVRILPIDSEHNAIFQCLNGASRGRGAPPDPDRERRALPRANADPHAAASRRPRRCATRRGTWAARSPSTAPR